MILIFFNDGSAQAATCFVVYENHSYPNPTTQK